MLAILLASILLGLVYLSSSPVGLQSLQPSAATPPHRALKNSPVKSNPAAGESK